MTTSVLPPVDFLFPSRGRARISHLWLSVRGGVLRQDLVSALPATAGLHGDCSSPIFKEHFKCFPLKEDIVCL